MDTPKPRLTRRYWIGLIAGLTVFASYALVNVLVDPTGEFGQSGRYAFNRAPPPAVIAAGVAGGNPAFFTRAIREHRGDVFLIGSSRTWRGFDTCSRPEVLRVAGSAWGRTELERVEQAVLGARRSPATLLIEVGLPTADRPAIGDPAQAALSTALSPRTTLFSVQTVANSPAGGARTVPTYAPCSPLAPGPVDWVQADRSLRYSLSTLDTTPASLKEGRRHLAEMADQADRMCRRTRMRHRLIFFTLPTAPDGSPAPSYDRIVQTNAVRIAHMFAARGRTSGGCDIRYVNFASAPPGDAEDRRLWTDRNQWSDYTHFSARLGATALDALLGPAVAPSDPPNA